MHKFNILLSSLHSKHFIWQLKLFIDIVEGGQSVFGKVWIIIGIVVEIVVLELPISRLEVWITFGIVVGIIVDGLSYFEIVVSIIIGIVVRIVEGGL